ncbi:hypothetical protein [Alteromonas halophila]|uniref:Uncharacterized protein n=1 Tax=Alteromonas halophila TaxID=516698 RepID=A0A918MZH9_9ALTE|nr:hypothetical protein [Alteromonas halophila]GGW92434.1 hypothetical protein GCM10007391_28510 [Alteromonas halophila]
MKKVVVAALGAVLVAGATGYISVLESDAEAENTELQESAQVSTRFSDISWKKVMESVPDYYTPPPPPKKKQNNDGKKAEKKKPKPTLISDARLMGVVEGESPAALVALPKTKEVQRIALGESWLKPWQLARVHADSVTWKNTETQKEHVQHLFR